MTVGDVQTWVAQNRTLLLLAAVGLILFLLLRTSPSKISASELDSRIATGQPVILELYSNF
jgi:hypothetical protein